MLVVSSLAVPVGPRPSQVVTMGQQVGDCHYFSLLVTNMLSLDSDLLFLLLARVRFIEVWVQATEGAGCISGTIVHVLVLPNSKPP